MTTQSKHLIQCLVLMTTLGLISACSSAKSISKAQDIVDTGRDNVVLLSYEITTDVFDRHASVKSNTVDLKCSLPGDGTAAPICFKMTLPYIGLVNDGDRTYHRFTNSEVRTFKMRYGQYPLERFVYGVTYDVRQEPYCYSNKKKKVVCTTRTHRDSNNFNAKLPEPVTFNVDAGAGCYLGHMKVRIIGDTMVEFDLDENLDPSAFDNLPESLREVTRLHVTKNCSRE